MPLVYPMKCFLQMRKWISLGFGEEFKSLRGLAIQERDAKESCKAKQLLLFLWEAIQT